MAKTPPPVKERRSRKRVGNVDTQWFKDKIAARDLSIRRLARVIKYDYSVLQNLISGKRAWLAHDVGLLADILGEPLREVWERTGAEWPSLDETAPIGGQIDSSGSVAPSARGVVMRRAPRPEQLGGSAVALVASCPEYQAMDGWLYYYATTDKVAPEAAGRLAVVAETSGRLWVRVLWRNVGGRSWVLRPFGVGEDITVEVAWAAPVLWIRC